MNQKIKCPVFILVIVCYSCAVFALASCGSGSSSSTVECEDGLINCEGACVDTGENFYHCGGCEVGCAAGEICREGACELYCPAGHEVCSGVCVNTQTDRNNCGECDNSCGLGEVCSAGNCSLSCQPGLTNCSGWCVNLQTNRTNCGSCGNTCDSGEVCSEGQCAITCSPGLIDCNGTCIDPLTSNHYCGASGDCLGENTGETCDPGYVCDGAGQCALSCQDGLIDCNGTCIDPLTSNHYCGASGDCLGENAGETCEYMESCVDGFCRDVVPWHMSLPLDPTDSTGQWCDSDPPVHWRYFGETTFDECQHHANSTGSQWYVGLYTDYTSGWIGDHDATSAIITSNSNWTTIIIVPRNHLYSCVLGYVEHRTEPTVDPPEEIYVDEKGRVWHYWDLVGQTHSQAMAFADARGARIINPNSVGLTGLSRHTAPTHWCHAGSQFNGTGSCNSDSICSFMVGYFE